MKKRAIFISIGLLICVCAAVIIITKNNTVHQSDYAFAEPGNNIVYDDNGMYYFNSLNYLMYMDNRTGESIPVCAKPNCTHNSDDCDAWYGGLGHYLLLYDDRIYISYAAEEPFISSDGFEQSHNIALIECANKDGSGRKEIYHKNSGAAISMLAVDGRLYYTAYEHIDEDWNSVDYFTLNQYLYCYNMDWGTTKKLQEYAGDYEHYNAGLKLLSYTDKNEIYLIYDYTVGQDTNNDYSVELLTMNMQGALKDQKMMDMNFNIRTVAIRNNLLYVSYQEDAYSENITSTLCRQRADGTFEDLLDLSELAASKWVNSFYYIYYDNSRTILLDFEKELCYISKSAVSDVRDVPDIYALDIENDVIYYDTTDYTGVAEGTTFSEDPRKLSCMKWSEFFEQQFVEYDWQQLGDLLIDKGED